MLAVRLKAEVGAVRVLEVSASVGAPDWRLRAVSGDATRGLLSSVAVGAALLVGLTALVGLGVCTLRSVRTPHTSVSFACVGAGVICLSVDLAPFAWGEGVRVIAVALGVTDSSGEGIPCI